MVNRNAFYKWCVMEQQRRRWYKKDTKIENIPETRKERHTEPCNWINSNGISQRKFGYVNDFRKELLNSRMNCKNYIRRTSVYTKTTVFWEISAKIKNIFKIRGNTWCLLIAVWTWSVACHLNHQPSQQGQYRTCWCRWRKVQRLYENPHGEWQMHGSEKVPMTRHPRHNNRSSTRTSTNQEQNPESQHI